MPPSFHPRFHDATSCKVVATPLRASHFLRPSFAFRRARNSIRNHGWRSRISEIIQFIFPSYRWLILHRICFSETQLGWHKIKILTCLKVKRSRCRREFDGLHWYKFFASFVKTPIGLKNIYHKIIFKHRWHLDRNTRVTWASKMQSTICINHTFFRDHDQQNCVYFFRFNHKRFCPTVMTNSAKNCGEKM